MRTLRLARIAAEAEGLRLRYSAKRTVTRTVLGVVALGFLLTTLAFCQIAGWFWVRMSMDRPFAALIMAGANLVIALALALLAARATPGRHELEALEVRRRALEGATHSLAFSAVATQLVPLAVRMLRRRG